MGKSDISSLKYIVCLSRQKKQLNTGYNLHANLSAQSETVKVQCSLVWCRYCLPVGGIENLGGNLYLGL